MRHARLTIYIDIKYLSGSGVVRNTYVNNIQDKIFNRFFLEKIKKCYLTAKFE